MSFADLLRSVGLAELLAVHTAGPNTVQLSYEPAGSDVELRTADPAGASAGDDSSGSGGGAAGRVAEEMRFECRGASSAGQLVGELSRRVELARHIASKRTRLRWAAFDSGHFQQQVRNI